jgi:hypothetical protein
MNTMTIRLSEARKLEKRLGVWVWDGLLFERDSIIDPVLKIIPNESGARIKRFLREIGTDAL